MSKTSNQISSLYDTEAYLVFQETIALQKIVLDQWDKEIWEYYVAGPSNVEPIILIPGVSGKAEQFFLQILGLSAKGYRVIAVTPSGSYSTARQWCRGFEKFLDGLGLKSCHILGTALGGFLGLCYAQVKPKRISSIILSNSFVDTQHFSDTAPCSGAYSLIPTFMLKRGILNNFPKGSLEVRILRSVDFMIDQVNSQDNKLLISRLSINTARSPLDAQNLPIPDKKITIIDVNDDIAIPQRLREEVYKFFPDASQALLKTGGNFPFLSRPSEFNMHVQVHLRKHMPQVHLQRKKQEAKRKNSISSSSASSSSSVASSSSNKNSNRIDLIKSAESVDIPDTIETLKLSTPERIEKKNEN